MPAIRHTAKLNKAEIQEVIAAAYKNNVIEIYSGLPILCRDITRRSFRRYFGILEKGQMIRLVLQPFRPFSASVHTLAVLAVLLNPSPAPLPP